jgi:hypothetical protein
VQFSFRIRKERGFVQWLMQKRKARELVVRKMMEKLLNPFALVFQGFLAGGLLFWATQADASSFVTAIF